MKLKIPNWRKWLPHGAECHCYKCYSKKVIKQNKAMRIKDLHRVIQRQMLKGKLLAYVCSLIGHSRDDESDSYHIWVSECKRCGSAGLVSGLRATNAK